MLVLLSPAKTLDFATKPQTKKTSQPRFVNESTELIEVLRTKSPSEISKLMSLSEDLSLLNVERYQDWEPSFTKKNAKAAVLAFKGDTYVGLDVDRFDERDFTHAQKVLRILSGLHGLLRPLDLIHPYRLEMGTKLATRRGRNLYDYWGDSITSAINADLAERKSNLVVNLASTEYFSAVRVNEVQAKVVTPVFLDESNGDYKMLGFFAKRARGAMAAWIVQNRLTSARALRNFDDLGYRFDAARSTASSPTFTRAECLRPAGGSTT